MGKKLKEFQDEMHWNNDDLIAQFHWAVCVEAQACAESLEAEYESYLEDYYSDYDAEMLRETMWITNHC